MRIFTLVIILVLMSIYSDNINAQSDNIVDVNLCELMNSPEAFDKQFIRIKAIYVKAAITSHIYSTECADKKDIWVEFGPGYSLYTKQEYNNVINSMECETIAYSPANHRSQSIITFDRAEVTVIGKFFAQLPAKVGRQFETIESLANTENSTSSLITKQDNVKFITTDLAHENHFKCLFIVSKIEKINEISKETPW
jgi:hypothetical protein